MNSMTNMKNSFLLKSDQLGGLDKFVRWFQIRHFLIIIPFFVSFQLQKGNIYDLATLLVDYQLHGEFFENLGLGFKAKS